MRTTEQNDATLDSTRNTFDRHEESVQVTPYHADTASFLGWKWSFLIAVQAISRTLYEGLKKIEDNMNQDFR